MWLLWRRTSDAAACGSTGNGADVDAAGGTSLRVVYLRNRKGIEYYFGANARVTIP